MELDPRYKRLLRIFAITEITSSTVVGSNCCNLRVDGDSRVSKGGQTKSTVDVSIVASVVLMVEIFVMKYSLNV